MTLLVTLYCLTIGLTYDRAVFTHKSLRNRAKILCRPIFLTVTPYAPCMFMQQCLSRSVETNYNDFKSFVDSVMDACIPTKMTSSRDNMPWFNNTLKRMCKKKQRLFNKAKKIKRAQHWEQYKSFKRDTLKAIRKRRWSYINDVRAPARFR